MVDAPLQSVLAALADVVVAAINDSGILPVTANAAERLYAPIVDLTNLGDAMRCSVLTQPGDSEDRLDSLGVPVYNGSYSVEVTLYQRFSGAPNGAVCLAMGDLILATREAIRTLLKVGAAIQVPNCRENSGAIYLGAEGRPAYGEATVVEKHTFVSAQVLTFQILV
jgi:hypothetical protein